jgi:hypothetical protein
MAHSGTHPGTSSENVLGFIPNGKQGNPILSVSKFFQGKKTILIFLLYIFSLKSHSLRKLGKYFVLLLSVIVTF